jgi:type IV secretory pathway VirB10-like protein
MSSLGVANGAASVPRSQPAQATASIDEIADAVVRATTRAGGAVGASAAPAGQAPSVTTTPARGSTAVAEPSPPTQTGPISSAGPLHRLLEGSIIDTVLTNRLDGGSAAPVNCLVTNPVYSHSGQQIVIPAGARVLGDTKPVQAFGETRLAVAFHRLVMPDGSTHSLDHPPALNQIGDAGLRDQVNQHYWSTFGAAAAVGLISGLAQFVGTAGFTGGTGDRTVIIAGGAADAAAQASLQVMNRFLNRLPTVTIREGHRIKVYLTSDLDLPAYSPPAGS